MPIDSSAGKIRHVNKSPEKDPGPPIHQPPTCIYLPLEINAGPRNCLELQAGIHQLCTWKTCPQRIFLPPAEHAFQKGEFSIRTGHGFVGEIEHDAGELLRISSINGTQELLF